MTRHAGYRSWDSCLFHTVTSMQCAKRLHITVCDLDAAFTQLSDLSWLAVTPDGTLFLNGDAIYEAW
jgi:hypothetical protein